MIPRGSDPASPSVVALIAPIIITCAFQVAFRYGRPRQVWLFAVVILVVASAVLVWFDRHAFTARSPYTFALLVIVPGIAAGGIAQLGTATRWPWPVTTIIGSLAAISLVIPMWFGACMLAESMHLSGCRF